MPYIAKESRCYLNLVIKNFTVNTPGILNYIITRICHVYIKNVGLKYSTLNEVIGVLECAKQELIRQVVNPYEDKKKAENGNISELDKE